MSALDLILITITTFLMIIGFLGTLVPSLPGLPLLWGIVMIYGITTKFEEIDKNFMVLTTLLVGLIILLDLIASLRGTQKIKASFWGALGAIIGGFVGASFHSLATLVIMPIVGAVIAELLTGRDAIYKVDTKSYHFIGFVGGTIVKVAVGVTLITMFLAKVL
jgi:uncharacterized protein YqgC (DUF456 family)